MKMKYGYLFLFSLLIFVLFANIIEVNAVNTGFQTNHIQNEEENIFISNINILLIDKEPLKKTITCFDVNSNHLIAIGQSTMDRKTICIYSTDGLFQYGYTFNCDGDFGVEWDEENLNIYFVRSSIVVSVTPSGEILDVLEVQNTIENNSYRNHFIYSTRRIIDDTEYFIDNDFGILNLFALSFSRIIMKDTTGDESIIYDVSAMQLSNILLSIIIVSIFVFLTIAVIVYVLKKTRDGTKKTRDGTMSSDYDN